MFYGTATATAEHGNGGLIELSSSGTITHSSPLNISTTSTYGNTGTLLIDPANILIADPATFNTFNSFRALISGGTTDPNALQRGANFGISVALNSTHALIGAQDYHYSGNPDSGNAFLFNLSTNTWTDLLATVGAPAPQANAEFGRSVALSATHALIGAPSYDYPSNSNSGNAYLYTLNSGAWTGTSTDGANNGLLSLTTTGGPSPQGSAFFGRSVALSATHALIGAYRYHYPTTPGTADSGNAYLYTLPTTETPAGIWTGTNGLLSITGAPTPQGGAEFGYSVALNSTHALIGTWQHNHSGNDSGNAYLYQIGNTAHTAWTGTFMEVPEGENTVYRSNGLLSTTGAPNVTLSTSFGARFGASVALNATYALIGARDYHYPSQANPDTGNAYLYTLPTTETPTGTWTGTNGLLSLSIPNAPTLQTHIEFGYSVALNSTHALIGARDYVYSFLSDSGNAYLYTLPTTDNPNGIWTGTNGLLSTSGAPAAQLSAEFGISVALNETYALIGARYYDYPTFSAGGLSCSNSSPPSCNTGNAWLYHISSGTWIDLLDSIASIQTPPTPQANAQFGSSVALSSTHALIGSNNYDYSGTSNSGNAFLYNLSTNTWVNLLATIDAPSPQTNANFGSSVALSTTHALIGVDDYDYSSTGDSGNAFLYNLSNGTWTNLLATTGAPAPQGSARFGRSVALTATHALIGAYNYNYSSASFSGNAYLYTINGGTWTGTNGLLSVAGAPSAQAGAFFGSSVALSTTHALIGADSYTYSGTILTGNAYLYTISNGTWAGTATAGANNGLLSTGSAPAAQAGAFFGNSVALNATHALVGANQYHYSGTADSGNAYLYTISNGTWTGTATAGANNGLLSTTSAPAPQGGAIFGWSVALNATHALIGAYRYNYTPSGGTATSDSGNAYLYSLSGGSNAWTDLLGTTGAPAPQANARFGNSAALSATHALIGAYQYHHSSTADSGNAYLYTLDGGNWINLFDAALGTPIPQTDANFGSSVALTDTHALIGARSHDSSTTITNSGNAYLYNLSNNTWTNLLATPGAPDAQANARFGSSVALSSTHALIGAVDYSHTSGGTTTSFSGSAYLYTISNGTWTDLLATTNAPAAQANARFGVSVALNATRALIGASRYNRPGTTQSGAAYFYTLSGGDSAWTDLFSITATNTPTPVTGDNFGSSVALTDTHALIGAALYEHSSTSNSGNAFLYTITGSTWTNLLATTSAPTAQISAQFGTAAALSSTHALIGAIYYYPTTPTTCNPDPPNCGSRQRLPLSTSALRSGTGDDAGAWAGTNGPP